MTRRIARSPLLLLAAALLSPVADAHQLRERGKAAPIAETRLVVTPSRDWNRLTWRPGKKTELWSLDGERLNAVTWYGGIAPGETLVREVSRKKKPLPTMTRETLLVEVPELLEATSRAATDVASFTVTETQPARFLGRDGIRFTYAFVDAAGLPRRGEGRATMVDGALYMATLDAPRLHFFEAALPDFRAMADAATLAPPPPPGQRPA